MPKTGKWPRTEEERLRRKAARTENRRRKLAEDPEGFRAKQAAAMRRWTERVKAADPEGYREKRRAESAARKVRDKAENPENFYAMRHAHQKTYYDRMRLEQPEDLRIVARRKYYRRHGISKKKTDEVMAIVRKLCPADLLGDIASAVMLEILEGRAPLKRTAEVVKEQIRAHRRQYDTFKNLSLDALHPVTGRPWLDDLESDAAHF